MKLPRLTFRQGVGWLGIALVLLLAIAVAVWRGDILKVLWFDGQGMLLLAKRLERGRFIWPQAAAGGIVLSPAQLSMLLEGIDWRMPARTHTPDLAA